MSDFPQTYPLPVHRPEVIDFLTSRRSNLVKVMTGPGPDVQTRDRLLEIAARVPDHRKLTPWRFIVFEGDARRDFGEKIASVFRALRTELPEDRMEFELERFMRAPLVVAVISSPVDCPRGTPVWEQELSAGAVCLTLCQAAQAHGFGAQWLTEWYAYNDDINLSLGLAAAERVAGFIYIGIPKEAASARKRPALENLIEMWRTS